jgi:hypothetical protein
MSRVTRAKSAGIACFVGTVLLGVAAFGFNGQGPGKSVRDGVFTKSQADRGAITFEMRCVACHTDPKFGPSVIDKWDGEPVSELFIFVSGAMPEDSPGSMRPEQYAEVLASFFNLRGLPAGETDLATDVEALKNIRIEKPVE